MQCLDEHAWVPGILWAFGALAIGSFTFRRAAKDQGGPSEAGEVPEVQGPLYVLISVGPAPYAQGEELWNVRSREELGLLYRMYADGAFTESRCIGDSEEAIECVRWVLKANGYRRLDVPMTGNSLYQPGDECYVGAGVLFAFVCPEPQEIPGASGSRDEQH